MGRLGLVEEETLGKLGEEERIVLNARQISHRISDLVMYSPGGGYVRLSGGPPGGAKRDKSILDSHI